MKAVQSSHPSVSHSSMQRLNCTLMSCAQRVPGRLPFAAAHPRIHAVQTAPHYSPPSIATRAGGRGRALAMWAETTRSWGAA